MQGKVTFNSFEHAFRTSNTFYVAVYDLQLLNVIREISALITVKKIKIETIFPRSP